MAKAEQLQLQLTSAEDARKAKDTEVAEAVAEKDAVVAEFKATVEALKADATTKTDEIASLRSKLDEAIAVAGDNESEAVKSLTTQLENIRVELDKANQEKNAATSATEETAGKL